MKSGKQRRIELKARQQVRQAKRATQALAMQAAEQQLAIEQAAANGVVLVDHAALMPNHSYSEPDFARRGYYLDQPFSCAGCKSPEVWTAGQQKWWYEAAKGGLFTTAKFCRPCRRQAQARRTAARRVHLAGIANKAANKPS